MNPHKCNNSEGMVWRQPNLPCPLLSENNGMVATNFGSKPKEFILVLT
jgi:hypothetical protein